MCIGPWLLLQQKDRSPGISIFCFHGEPYHLTYAGQSLHVTFCDYIDTKCVYQCVYSVVCTGLMDNFPLLRKCQQLNIIWEMWSVLFFFLPWCLQTDTQCWWNVFVLQSNTTHGLAHGMALHQSGKPGRGSVLCSDTLRKTWLRMMLWQQSQAHGLELSVQTRLSVRL